MNKEKQIPNNDKCRIMIENWVNNDPFPATFEVNYWFCKAT